MSKLNLSKSEFVSAFQSISQGDFTKLDKVFSSIQSAIQGWDFDSGWIATPSDGGVFHDLGAVPMEVVVYASDDKYGSGMVADTFSAVTDKKVTINGAKSFCRVLAEK